MLPNPLDWLVGFVVGALALSGCAGSLVMHSVVVAVCVVHVLDPPRRRPRRAVKVELCLTRVSAILPDIPELPFKLMFPSAVTRKLTWASLTFLNGARMLHMRLHARPDSQEELVQIGNAVDVANQCSILVELIAHFLRASGAFPVVFHRLHLATFAKPIVLVDELIIGLLCFFVLQILQLERPRSLFPALP